MKTIAIVQARLGSTRLPGKVMQLLLECPMLWWSVYRLKKSPLLDDVVVATTLEPRDDPIVEFCEREGLPVHRGSEDNVLERYYQAAGYHEADYIIRVTSDCPLIDTTVVDYVVAAYQSSVPPVDYASNTLERSYPRGLDVEIFSFAALEKAWQEDRSGWREHVTPYIYNNPQLFRLLSIKNPVDYSRHRWTVDTAEDLELVRRIYEHFGHGDFHWREVIALLEANPDWVKINQHIEQKKV